jgi:phage-related protein
MNVFDLEASLSLKISDFKEKLSSAKDDMQKAKSAVADVQNSFTSAGGGLKGFAASAKTAWSDVQTFMTTTGVGAAIKEVCSEFKEAADQTAEYGDEVEKSSQKLGMTTTQYQTWSYVLKQSGSSIDSMQASMKTLATAAETGNSAFTQLGITQTDLKNLNQEQLFEKTISSLQNVSDTTERTYLASQLLGRGATDLGDLLNKSASETDELKEKASQLGGVMSEEGVKSSAEYEDAMDNIDTALTGLRNNIMVNFMPSLTELTDGVADMISGNNLVEGMDQMSSSVYDFFTGLIKTIPTIITDAAKFLVTAGGAIIEAIVKGITNAAGDVITGFNTIVNTISDKVKTEGWSGLGQEIINDIGNGIKTVGSNIWNALSTFLSDCTGNMKKVNWAETGKNIMTTLFNGIKTFVATLGSSVAALLNDVGTALHSVNWVDVGKTIFNTLINGVKAIGSTLWSIISGIFTTTKDSAGQTNWLDTGAHIINSIISGIGSIASGIWQALWGILQGAMSSATSTNWLDVGTHVINSIISGIGSIGASIWSNLKSWFDNAMTQASNIDWGQVGSDIINGIINGINSLGSSIGSTLQSWASDALNGVKSFLGISSPSRVFSDEIGGQIMAGIGTGISGKTGETNAKMKSSISGIVKAAKDSVSSVSIPLHSDYSQNMTYSHTLTSKTSGVPENNGMTIQDALSDMHDTLKKYLPDLAERNVVLDTGTMVGALTPHLDKKLGRIAARKARGASE